MFFAMAEGRPPSSRSSWKAIVCVALAFRAYMAYSLRSEFLEVSTAEAWARTANVVLGDATSALLTGLANLSLIMANCYFALIVASLWAIGLMLRRHRHGLLLAGSVFGTAAALRLAWPLLVARHIHGTWSLPADAEFVVPTIYNAAFAWASLAMWRRPSAEPVRPDEARVASTSDIFAPEESKQ